MHKKRVALFSFFLAITIFSSCNTVRGSLEQPNIILIFADDLGYGDIGSFNPEIHHTPNLDKLAENGVRLTQFYVTAPVCTPSRAALLTGRHHLRSYTHSVFLGPDEGLGLWEETLAETLKSAGYATAIVGKWHLGVGNGGQFLPTRQGFDHFFGTPFGNSNDLFVLYENEQIVDQQPAQKDLTRRFTEFSLQLIGDFSAREAAFFLYLPFTAPHAPLFVPEDFARPAQYTLYEDVVRELDWAVGKIMRKLDDLGIAENTILIFTSDNGTGTATYSDEKIDAWGATDSFGRSRLEYGSNGDLRGAKGQVYEGGIRVPFIIRWPAGLGEIPQGGKTLDEPVISYDLYPTLAGLAGANPTNHRIDGKDIFPVLTGRDPGTDRDFFFTKSGSWTVNALRSGEWKIHFDNANRPIELYDMGDPAESENLIDQHPEIAAELAQKASAYNADLNERSLLQRLDHRISQSGIRYEWLLMGGTFAVGAAGAILLVWRAKRRERKRG